MPSSSNEPMVALADEVVVVSDKGDVLSERNGTVGAQKILDPSRIAAHDRVATTRNSGECMSRHSAAADVCWLSPFRAASSQV